MKYILSIFFALLTTCAFAQKADSLDLARCVTDLNTSLVGRDTLRLRLLLRSDLHYYHSNGWLQTKRDVISDLYNGKLTYKTINATDRRIRFLTKTLANVSTKAEVDAVMNGKPIHLNLDVTQMWTWKDNRWELFSRLSKRIALN